MITLTLPTVDKDTGGGGGGCPAVDKKKPLM